MLGGLRGRWLLAMGIAAAVAGTVLGFWFGAPIAGGVSLVAETIARTVGWQPPARPEVLSLPRDEATKDAPSTTQSLTGFDELSYAVYELVGGRRTNFQNVKTFPKNSLIRQLANGVGSLRITFKGQDDSHACTAFVVSDKPGETYALTAGHCLYQDGVCPAGKTSAAKTPPAIAEMYLVFNQFENVQLLPGTATTNPNAIPATLVKDELKCGNVDSTDKDKPYVDYAVVKLDDDKFQEHRRLNTDNQIAPVSLGVVEIEPRHQLLILSQPDGRALMATERNCLATEHPGQPNGSFAHYCDTLKGSSGAPVFSRDHAVVAGLHTRSQYNPFAAGEENIAIPIETIVNASLLLQSLNILIKDPLTAEQKKLIDYANQRGQESAFYLNVDQGTVATYLALNGLERILERNRDDNVCLINQSYPAQRGLAEALSRNRELARLHLDGPVRSAAFSPDGTRVVTASEDTTARLWDARSGAPIGEVMKHQDWVVSAAFSPDGTRVVTAWSTAAALWDARTGASVGEVMKHGGHVKSAAFSPDSNRVVTASNDGTARLWDARTGAPVGAVMRHDDIVLSAIVVSAAFSPDGTRVVTASEDKTARLWDTRTGARVGALMKHDGRVRSAAFSPDGTRVVTASDDKTARQWDARTGASVGEVMKHDDIVWSAAFSPDGTRVVTASADKTARLWDARTGAPLEAVMKHASAVLSAAFSHDRTRVVTASGDQTARLWDARTGAAHVGKEMMHADLIRDAEFSPDGTRLVTASGYFQERGEAHLWDAHTGAPVGAVMKHDDIVRSAAFSPDGTRVVTASNDKTARLWDARTGAPFGAVIKHAGVSSAAFSPDGTRVVTASEDKTARLWDARTGAPVGEVMKHDDLVLSAAFSPDGTRVVTASDDDTARLWDARTGAPVGEVMKHDRKAWSADVQSAAFSPDGTRVVTASEDKTARL